MKSNGGGYIVVVGAKNTEYVCDVNGKASKIRSGTNSPVMFAIFEYYAAYARSIGETYWDELFTNASKNNFPSKIYKVVNNNTLTAKISSNNFNYFNLIPSSREELPYFYEKCKEFITNNSGSACKDDIYIEVESSKYEPEPWSGSIPPQRQVAMIDIFVNEKSREFNLSDKVTEELKESLITKLFIGELGNKIQKYGHTIIGIEGLVFQNGKFWLPTDLPKTNFNSKKKVPTTCQEEEVSTFVFKCSKNISASLKHRVVKGFDLGNFQFA